MGNELTGRRSVADITGQNRTARYDELIFSADAPQPNNTLEEFGLTFSGLDEDSELENPWLPPQLQPDETQTPDVSIDELAHDILKEYDPDEITFSQPTSWKDYDLDADAIAKIEKKVISAPKNSDNPLKGVTRWELTALPYLPYLAAIRDMLDFTSDGPKYTGSPQDLHDKVLLTLNKFPSENADYASPTGNMLRKLVQEAGMLRQAALFEKVTRIAYTDDADHLAGNDDFFASLTEDQEPEYHATADFTADFIDDVGSFGSPDMPVPDKMESAAIRSGLAKSMELTAIDMTNTKLAQHLAKNNISETQAVAELRAQGLDSDRTARVVRLMKAYAVVGQE